MEAFWRAISLMLFSRFGDGVRMDRDRFWVTSKSSPRTVVQALPLR